MDPQRLELDDVGGDEFRVAWALRPRRRSGASTPPTAGRRRIVGAAVPIEFGSHPSDLGRTDEPQGDEQSHVHRGDLALARDHVADLDDPLGRRRRSVLLEEVAGQPMGGSSTVIEQTSSGHDDRARGTRRQPLAPWRNTAQPRA